MEIDSLADDIVCPQCGYDLRAIESPRCPECGCEIDREALRQSIIPWTNRRRIGRVRAFLKTAWMTIRHPSAIANEPRNSVNFRAAQYFRWTAVTCAWVALTGWIVAFQMIARQPIFQAVSSSTAQGQLTSQQPWPGLLCWLRYVTSAWYFTPALIFFMLAAASGVASYFFQPRELETSRQGRAIALSYYGCGPMTFIVIPATFCGLAVLKALYSSIQERSTRFPIFDLYYLGDLLLPSLVGISLVGLTLIALHTAIRIVKKTTDCSTGRQAMIAIALPLLWLAIGAVFLLLIPAALGLVQIMVESYIG